VGIFSDDQPVIRLVGAVLAEQHDDWQTTDRRYLSEGCMRLIDQPLSKEVTTTPTPELPAASSAGEPLRVTSHFHHSARRRRRNVSNPADRVRCWVRVSISLQAPSTRRFGS
jgi:hypothetical protein